MHFAIQITTFILGNRKSLKIMHFAQRKLIIFYSFFQLSKQQKIFFHMCKDKEMTRITNIQCTEVKKNKK